jgi:OOP family OmpA-OmpF porin
MKPYYGLVCVIVGLSLSCDVAAENFWYAGVSVGTAEASQIRLEDIDDGSALSGSTEDNDFGWKIFGGYAFNRFIAIETAYIDLGEVSIDAVSDGTGVVYAPGAVTASIATSGFSLSMVGSVPVSERIGLHAKLGVFVWEAKSQFNNAAFPPTSRTDDGSDFAYGIGASYTINDRFTIRGEYEIFTNTDTEDGLLASLGVTYAF